MNKSITQRSALFFILFVFSAILCSLVSYATAPVPIEVEGDTLWVHPSDYEKQLSWGSEEGSGDDNTGAQSETDGWENTQAIIAYYGESGGTPYAASACGSLSVFGYDDWYLPAKDELQLLYDNKDMIGGFNTTQTYWSSTEYSISTEAARALDFNNNNMNELVKYNKYNVRCVRKDPPPLELEVVGYRFFSSNHAANAEVLVSQGREPLYYAWSHGDTTRMVNNLSEGMYYVTVSGESYSEAIVDSIEINADLTVHQNYVLVDEDTVWVSPEDAPDRIKWGESRSVDEGNGAQSKTNGVFNTLSIIEEYGKEEMIAAYYCDSMNLLSYDDWYLPAEDELMAMYNARDEIYNGFAADAYWSSNEVSSSDAKGLDFSTGEFNNYFKPTCAGNDPNLITRCVRRNNRFPDSLTVELDTIIQPLYPINPEEEKEYTCFVQFINHEFEEFELHCYFEEDEQFCRYIDGDKYCGTLSGGFMTLTNGEETISVSYQDESGMAYSFSTTESRMGQLSISVSGGSGFYDIAWSSTDSLFNSDSVYNPKAPLLFISAGTYYATVTDRYTHEQLVDSFVVNSYVAKVDDTIVCPGETVDFKSYELSEEGTFPVWARGDEESPDTLYYFTVEYIRPHIDPICIVTIDLETGKNMVVWERTSNQHTASYNVYRETTFAGVYAQLGSVPFDSISLYVDMSSIPEQQQYLYKITTVDVCGQESDIDSCNVHKTMLLQYSGSSGGINLNWGNRYEINGVPVSFDSYIIYRGTTISSLDSLNVISGSNYAYIDTDPQALTEEMFYRVAGVKNTSCSPAGMFKASTGPFSQSISNIEDNRLRSDNSLNERHKEILLFEAYPNPAKEKVTIDYALETAGDVSLDLYSILGNKIKTLDVGYKQAGAHTFFCELPGEGVFLLYLRKGGVKQVIKLARY